MISVVALLVSGTAEATASTVIAQGTNSKGLIAVATGTAKAPISYFSVNVKTTPTQKVTVDWSLLCQIDGTADPGQGTPTVSDEGSFEAHAPLTHTLKSRAVHPRTCLITVYATLSKKGKATVRVLKD